VNWGQRGDDATAVFTRRRLRRHFRITRWRTSWAWPTSRSPRSCCRGITSTV